MQTYDEVVDTGIDWIGSIPKGWAIEKVKRVFLKKNEKSTSKYPAILSLARAGVKVRDISSNEGQLAASYDNYNPVEPGDVLLNPMDLQSGANCSISKVEGVISPAYVNLRPKGENSSQFFDYYFKLQYWSRAFFVHGRGISYDNRWTLGNETLMNYPVVVPVPEQQQKIADFLDTETAKIDNLIAKQERLLQLLEEKCRATITHAVTRGLNPNVEFKETNIPWLGKIPAHWKITKVGYEAKFESGGYPLPKNINEPKTEPWILIGDMQSDVVKGTAGISKKDVEELCLRQASKGELLFSFKMSIGKVAIAGHDMYTTSEIATFYDMDSISISYAFYMFPIYIPKNAKKNMMGSDLMNLKLIRQAMIALPNIEEQDKIVNYLDEECSRIKNLKLKTQTQIKLLRERRTSLISHAVTGKIKV